MDLNHKTMQNLASRWLFFVSCICLVVALVVSAEISKAENESGQAVIEVTQINLFDQFIEKVQSSVINNEMPYRVYLEYSNPYELRLFNEVFDEIYSDNDVRLRVGDFIIPINMIRIFFVHSQTKEERELDLTPLFMAAELNRKVGRQLDPYRTADVVNIEDGSFYRENPLLLSDQQAWSEGVDTEEMDIIRNSWAYIPDSDELQGDMESFSESIDSLQAFANTEQGQLLILDTLETQVAPSPTTDLTSLKILMYRLIQFVDARFENRKEISEEFYDSMIKAARWFLPDTTMVSLVNKSMALTCPELLGGRGEP